MEIVVNSVKNRSKLFEILVKNVRNFKNVQTAVQERVQKSWRNENFKTFKIEKKRSKSKKKFKIEKNVQNREKNVQNREKTFKYDNKSLKIPN